MSKFLVPPLLPHILSADGCWGGNGQAPLFILCFTGGFNYGKPAYKAFIPLFPPCRLTPMCRYLTIGIICGVY